jgi:hypothetical protein
VAIRIGKNDLRIEGRYSRSFGGTYDDIEDLDSLPEDTAFVADETTGEALDLDISAIFFVVSYGFRFGS